MTDHILSTSVDTTRQQTWKVLVIEDDARWRTLVEVQLQAAGHTVLTAADGLAGLALAAAMPDVILFDSEIPFIFLTGKTARADQRKGMVLGADDYLTKPFQPEELIASIAGVLAKRASLVQRLRHYTEEHHREITAPWAHELLTPLNGILGAASLLESEPGTISDSDLRELAHSIRVSAQRQQTLARKLIQHFQLEQFRESRWSDPTAAVEVRANLEDEVLGLAEQAGRSSDLRLDCAPAAVRLNPPWLRAAARELAANALN